MTLIAGENIYVDSTVRSAFISAISNVPKDFEGRSSNEDYTNATKALESQDYVTSVEPFVSIGRVEVNYSADKASSSGVISFNLIGVRASFRDELQRLNMRSSFALEQHSVILSDIVAKELNVRPGDRITLYTTMISANQTKNLTVTVSDILSAEKNVLYTPLWPYSILVNITEEKYFAQSLGLTGSGDGKIPPDSGRYTYYIWIDRGRVLNPADKEGSLRLLTKIERALNSAGKDYGVSVQMDDFLRTTIEQFDIELTFIRMILLGISLPIIVLGIYLGATGVDLGMGERRMEIGILKSRGATDNHVFLLLLTEAIIAGIFAGILGLLVGVGVSRIIMSMFSSVQSADYLSFDISLGTVLLSIIFAIVFMLIASYRPARRFSKLSIRESLHYYLGEEAKVQYKPLWDIVFVLLAVLTYCLMIYLNQVKDQSIMMMLCMLGIFMIVLIPLSPFFFIIGLTRLLTRSTTKLYDYVSRVSKVFAKDLWHIVNKNIVRNPRRASNVCVIISMGIAFGIFISTMVGSEIAYEERVTRAEIGGDLWMGTSANITFSDNLTAIDGIEKVTPVLSLPTQDGYTVVGIDASTYIRVVPVEGFYFVKGSPSDIERLKDGDKALIDKTLAEGSYYDVGDSIEVKYRYTQNGSEVTQTKSYEIIGIVKVLPGTSSLGGGGYSRPVPVKETTQTHGGDALNFWGGTLYADINALDRRIHLTLQSTFLADVAEGRNASAVADEIRDRYPSTVYSVRVLTEELKEGRGERFQAIINFLNMEYGFAIIIVSVGMAIIIYTASVEREGEFANIMCRGASKRQISSLLMGEAVTIIIIGVFAGCITGFITAYAFNDLLSFFMNLGGGMSISLDRPLEVPLLTPILLVITIIALFVGAYLATIRIRRMQLIKVLRQRGG